MPGKVYVVGAGPGSADLLTLRAVSRLRAAQVVLHDDLVPAEILELCAFSARVINVGKRCGRHANSQEQINALMVWHARAGKTVVRLKSGDPAVFGRLGEELEELRQAGVEFEVVPGITAASAAAAAAGITLTDRRAASALVTLTAHNCRGEKLRAQGFDPQHTTFAVYMPGPDYGRTAHELMESGVDASAPCAVVSRAGRVNEEVRFLALSNLGSVSGIAAPAILIVGEVARTENNQDPPRRHEDTEKLFSEIASEERDTYPPLSCL
jgi:uroporphyrin-III C-methyltransferase